MKKFIFLIIFFITRSLLSQHLIIENIENTDKFLPEEQILSYLMDETGDIWLSAEGSLYHYNGFCNQKVNLELAFDDYVITIHHLGNHQYLLLSKYKFMKMSKPLSPEFKVQTLITPQKKREIYINFIPADSLVYVLSTGTFFKYNLTSRKTDTLLRAEKNEIFLTLNSSGDEIYISGNDRRSYIYQTDIQKLDTLVTPKFNLFGLQKLSQEQYIAQSISKMNHLNNKLLIFKIDSKDNHLVLIPEEKIDLSFNERINEEITFFEVINSNMFFVWTTNQGAFLVTREGDVTPINSSTGLISNEIVNVHYYDPFIVVLTPKGISYVKNPNVLIFSREDGLPDENVWTIHKIRGKFYINTSSGLGILEPGSSIKYSIKKDPYFSKSSIYGLSFDKRGNLWISLGDFNGIYKIRNGKINHLIPKLGDDLSFTIDFIPVDENHLILMGSKFVYLYDYKHFKKISLTDSLHNSDERIANIQRDDKDSLLYITTTKGIWKLNKYTLDYKRFTSYQNCFISYVFKDGSYIIGDGRSRTYLVRGETDSLLLTYKFCAEKVYNIRYIPSKHLIILTDNAGVHLIDENFTFVKHINELNGLPVNETNQGGCLIDGNNLWIGTTKGAVRINIDNWKHFPEYHWNIQSSFHFFNFKEDQSVQLNNSFQNLKIDSDKNNIKLDFSPIFPFSLPLFTTKAKILSKKLALEKKGQYNITLTNLPSGEYDIHYRFYWRNQLYTLSSGTIHLIIEPPYYKRTWFWFLVISGAGILIGGFFGLRSYRLNKLNQKLSFMVNQQTEHIERMNSILEGVLNNINEIILVFGTDGKVLLKNENIKDPFFANIENINELLSYLPEEVRININVIMENHLMDSIRGTEPLKLNDQMYMFYFNPLLVENKLEGYSLFLMNISQLLENEQLKVKIETLNQIFATFSHYLNNYLQSIVLYLDLYYFSPETFDIQKAFDEIRLSVSKIQMIIDNIEEILNSKKYETMDYAGIKNILIKLNMVDENN